MTAARRPEAAPNGPGASLARPRPRPPRVSARFRCVHNRAGAARGVGLRYTRSDINAPRATRAPASVKPRAGLILELVVNLLLPWVAYRVAHPYFGETGALYASAIPPIVWSVVEFIRSRRIDAVAAVVLLGIALSIAGMALGGSARTLLMRESLASGTIGVVFLLSLFRDRPLIFYLARATVAREMAGGAARFETVWAEQPGLRQMLRLMTFVWGACMTLEMLLRLWMVVTWPVERVLVVSPIMGYTVFGTLLLWTFWYRRRMRERNSVDIPTRDGVTEIAGR